MDIISETKKLGEAVTQPFPNSKKVYVQGSREDIQVGMREVSCADTSSSIGAEQNPPITIYDTSGPLTDPEQNIDLSEGLPKIRAPWIAERADTQQLKALSSEFGDRKSVV